MTGQVLHHPGPRTVASSEPRLSDRHKLNPISHSEKRESITDRTSRRRAVIPGDQNGSELGWRGVHVRNQEDRPARAEERRFHKIVGDWTLGRGLLDNGEIEVPRQPAKEPLVRLARPDGDDLGVNRGRLGSLKRLKGLLRGPTVLFVHRIEQIMWELGQAAGDWAVRYERHR